jgi:hypothetical protein
MRSDRFAGLEFDWVAADISGKLAVFCTGGYGPIPDKAMEAAEDQHAVMESIKTTTGFSEQSDFLTQRGACPLYCFDWKVYDGPYNLKRGPGMEKAVGIDGIPEDLRQSIVRLNVNFSARKSISADELHDS